MPSLSGRDSRVRRRRLRLRQCPSWAGARNEGEPRTFGVTLRANW